ncbi:MAG TPA: HlyD family efflux transporter periplasmic adaptor subunit [Coleofasciculaceae cyanobacterium]|jgi:multidrug efflux pump subunit AcrA (membrane-fusion protein)
MNQRNGSKLNQQIITTQLTDVNIGEHKVHTNSNSNGNGSNSNSNGKFDQPVILRQSHNWSRAILWTIVGVTTFGVIWASVAKIEQAVPAQGKLEPQGAVKDVQAPISGVVKEILVKDGQRVNKGDLLLRLDSTAAQAQLSSLEKIRATLIKENQFYRSVINNPTASSVAELTAIQLQLPKEIASLAESRKALVAENQLYRTQLSGDSLGTNLSPEQRARLQFATAELNSRIASNELEVGQLEKQLDQNSVQLANGKSRFEVEQGILNKIEILAKEGGIPNIQYLKQQQEVKTRQAEVDELIQEQGRLKLKISQAKQQLRNTVALSQKDLTTRLADNDKKISEIDTQLNKYIVENEKKLAEMDSQFSQTKLNLRYQELRAPDAGTVFDLKPSSPGFVANTSEPILKIVPADGLVAKVFLSNKDIGFVKEGMPVDVRIDSFPFSEFGDVKGEVVWIGSDALPPEQVRPFYSFPAKIRLKQQSLVINERKVSLQSGMSISANIRVRDRTVLSIFTDLFTSKTESLKTVR